MKYLGIMAAMAVLMCGSSFAAEDNELITRGGGHGGGGHAGGHAGGADFHHGGEFNRGYDHRNNWDYGGGYYGGWGGYDYVLPAPTYDPLQDPNDDMNQLYQQNLRNMERTGQ